MLSYFVEPTQSWKNLKMWIAQKARMCCVLQNIGCNHKREQWKRPLPCLDALQCYSYHSSARAVWRWRHNKNNTEISRCYACRDPCLTNVSIRLFCLFVCLFVFQFNYIILISHPYVCLHACASRVSTMHFSIYLSSVSQHKTGTCMHWSIQHAKLTQRSPWNNSDRGAHHRQFVLHSSAVVCSEGRPAPPSRELVPLGSLAFLI